MHYPRVYYIYELFVEDMFRWFQHLQIVWKILTGQSRVNGRENCESSCQQLLKEDEEAQRTISEKEIRVQFSARYERSKILTICNYNETCQYTSVFFWPLRPAGQPEQSRHPMLSQWCNSWLKLVTVARSITLLTQQRPVKSSQGQLTSAFPLFTSHLLILCPFVFAKTDIGGFWSFAIKSKFGTLVPIRNGFWPFVSKPVLTKIGSWQLLAIFRS